MKIVYGMLFLLTSANVALAAPVPAPEIGESFIGMAAVAGLVYLVRRKKNT